MISVYRRPARFGCPRESARPQDSRPSSAGAPLAGRLGVAPTTLRHSDTPHCLFRRQAGGGLPVQTSGVDYRAS